MEELRRRHIVLIKNTNFEFERYLYNVLPWNEQLVGIKGSRGVGKTTLLLQFIKINYNQSLKALYVSLDDLYFSENSLLHLADEFVAKGGEHLFVDEVHKYASWANDLKKIYDYHPTLKVVFTGSSLLEILNARADLSRRALVFTMQGLSFREYLSIKYKININAVELYNVFNNNKDISLSILEKVKPLKYFDEYLRIGYYPFTQVDDNLYFMRIREVVNMIMEIELPSLRRIDYAKIPQVKKLLSVLAKSVPFKPNISSLAAKINISRNSLLEYLNSLNDASIIRTIYKNSIGISVLQKPDKIYFENTNLIYAYSGAEFNKGNVRETFILNQLSLNHIVTYPVQGDFFVDNKYLLEVGGKNKSKKQIAGIAHSFIIADDIEIGFENKIPLWLFGFLY